MNAVTGAVRESVGPATAAPRGRLDWLDVAKGIGIILVVAGHAIGGIMSSSLPGKSVALPYAYAGIYAFHMDLFFFLSGLTVATRIGKDRGRFLRGNVTKIAYAYLVWAVIQYNVLYLAGSLANNPIRTYDLSLLLVGNVSQFWFLYVLFFLNLAAWALAPTIGVVALVAVAFVARPFASLFDPGDNFGHALQFALPYMLGVAIGAPRLDAMLGKAGRLPLLALAAFALAAEIVALSPLFGGMPAVPEGQKIIDFVYSARMLPTSTMLVAGVIGLSALAEGPVRRSLAYLGRMSLPVYILHIMCIAGLRILLAKFLHVSDIWLILAVIVPCGVAVPLVAVTVLDRLRLAKPLGLL